VRIERLELRDIRRFRSLDLEFAPGITVIRGPNEAGKTTIQRAIELAFTRKVTTSAADLETLRPWDAPPEAGRTGEVVPRVALTFVVDDDDQLRRGRLEKVFRGSRGTVRLELDGKVITDPAQADARLAELTGIPTEKFFYSTASIHHHEMARLDHDEAALRDRLQTTISGADRGTSRAKKALNDAIRRLTARGERNPGEIKKAQDEVTALERQVSDGEAELARLERDRQELARARQRRRDLEATLSERRSLLEKARLAEQLSRDLKNAQAEFERFREAVRISEEIADLMAHHPSPNPLPVLRQIVERLRQADGRIRELRARLGEPMDIRFEVPPEPTWRPLSQVALVLVVVGLVLAGLQALTSTGVVAGVPLLGRGGLGDLLGAGDGMLTWLALSLAGLGLVLAATAWWLRRRDRLQAELRATEIERRMRGRSQLEEELRQLEAEVTAQLVSIDRPDLPAAEALLQEETEHVERIDRLQAQLEGLVGQEPVEALPNRRDAAALEMEQKQHALDALGPIAREPRARERLEAEVAELEAQLDAARQEEHRALARVETNTVDAEAVSAAAERLAVARERLAALQRRQRVYELALRGIEEAERATMRTATRYLERRMVEDLARLTAGRYRRVRVDDTSLDIALFAPEKGDWVDVHLLSAGTVDLVFLAARIGLVRLVTGDRRPPLLLDDPFVTFDAERASRAFGLLRDLASDFQILFLTTSDRYDEAADRVVLLEGPTAVDSEAAAGT
jgi:uncharacterized protein YhaN